MKEWLEGMGVSDTAGDKARELLQAAMDAPASIGGPSDNDVLVTVLAGLGYAVLEVADAAWLLTALMKQPGDDSDDSPGRGDA